MFRSVLSSRYRCLRDPDNLRRVFISRPQPLSGGSVCRRRSILATPVSRLPNEPLGPTQPSVPVSQTNKASSSALKTPKSERPRGADEIEFAVVLERLQKLEESQPISSGPARSPTVEATLTALVGLLVVFFSGYAYVAWYKHNVLFKIELAFSPGYDPALELADRSAGSLATGHVRRKEQELVDRIIAGDEQGHYHLLLGPKGTGKGSMIVDAMRKIQADGTAVCEAHPDVEVFRVRLGKALNYDYNEDAQFGLFQRRDPKEGGPALDIERALNKLEKVALRCATRRKKPLVLIFNNIHLLHNDDEGKRLVRLLQQRAESWAESGVLTMVFCSDDFWPYTVLRKAANRMQVMSISDLSHQESLNTLKVIRKEIGVHDEPEATLLEAVRHVGGRLAVLNRVGRAKDLIGAAKEAVAREKSWLLSQIGLIPDCDDDVMDEQKWSSGSWLLLQEFVRMHDEMAKRAEGGDDSEQPPLPAIPYWKCRQIMTRGDFLEALDHANIVSIDINHDVRPDSVLILQAAREVCDEAGFQDTLNNVRDRVDEIESLHRTRELTLKARKPGRGWFDRLLGKS